jgi:hypothetical protein
LSQADAHRQELYGPLAAMSEDDKEKLDLEPEEEPEPEQEQQEAEDKFVPPTEEDRKAFLSALLGGKQYEKRFTLFGNVAVTFRDRTTADTERVLAILRNGRESGEMSADDYNITYDRYMLVLQLLSFNDKEYALATQSNQLKDVLDSAVNERLMPLPRPIYHAVLMAFRRFEEENSYMTERALDSDFWTCAGPASAPRRTSAARSTIPRTPATTRTGT